MLEIELKGGLGNQLFQLFFAITQARELGADLVVADKEELSFGRPRPTYWQSFLSALRPCLYKERIIEYMRRQAFLRKQYLLYVSPPKYEILPAMVSTLAAAKNGYVRAHGYFQSYRNFADTGADILRALDIPRMRAEVRADLETCLAETPIILRGWHKWADVATVSVHFRFGDYMAAKEYHAPIEDPSYYITALRRLMAVVRGDDRPWVAVLFYDESDADTELRVRGIVDVLREQFPQVQFVFFKDVFRKKIEEDWRELLAMSCCDHHVMANSTFSWWGAYISYVSRTPAELDMLSPDEEICDTKVYYPTPWFGPAAGICSAVEDDLCLPAWCPVDRHADIGWMSGARSAHLGVRGAAPLL